jgi:hypothetical protein
MQIAEFVVLALTVGKLLTVMVFMAVLVQLAALAPVTV